MALVALVVWAVATVLAMVLEATVLMATTDPFPMVDTGHLDFTENTIVIYLLTENFH